jgi:phenylacetate-coenzyme A ligase PaaK-like adenylate-forming protein
LRQLRYKMQAIDDFKVLPLLSKEEIRKNLEDMKWNDSPCGLGYHLDQLGVQVVFSTAEVLYDHQRKTISKRFGGTCACGRTWQTIQNIKGRTTDFVVTPDGRWQHALSVIYVVRDIEGGRLLLWTRTLRRQEQPG